MKDAFTLFMEELDRHLEQMGEPRSTLLEAVDCFRAAPDRPDFAAILIRDYREEGEGE